MAATPDWRTCVFALDTDHSPNSESLFGEVLKFVRGGSGTGGALTPRSKGRYYLLSKEDLLVLAKERGLKTPAQALVQLMKEEKADGVVRKANFAMRTALNAASKTSAATTAGDEKKEEAGDDPEDDDPEAMEKLQAKEAEEERKRAEQSKFDEAVAALDEVKEVRQGVSRTIDPHPL